MVNEKKSKPMELLIALQQMATEIAQARGVDPVLFSRLVMQESSWHPDANADKPLPSCIGLCQLNEGYGRYFIGLHGKGVVRYYKLANAQAGKLGRYWTDERVREALLDPRINLTIGARELHRLIQHFGDWQTALAAWNWGPGNLTKLLAVRPETWMIHLPAETQWMIAKVLLKDGLERYR